MQENRRRAAQYAARKMNFIDKSLPATVPVKRIVEGYENCNTNFKEFFNFSKYLRIVSKN